MNREQTMASVERALRSRGWTADEVKVGLMMAGPRIVARGADAVKVLTVNGAPYSVPDGADPVAFLVNDVAREARDTGAVPDVFRRIREEKQAEVQRQRAGVGLTLEQRLGMDRRPDDDDLERRMGMN